MSKKEITISALARMVQKGFEGMDKRFEGMDRRFDSIDERLDRIENLLIDHGFRIEKLEDQMQELRELLAVS